MQVKTYQSVHPDKQLNQRLVGHYFAAGVSLVVAVLLLGGFLWVAITSLSTTTDNRQRAVIDPVAIIRYNPESAAIVVGQEFTVPIELNTSGRAIAIAEVLPTFDTAYFQALSLTGSTFLSTTLIQSSVTASGTFTSLLVAKPVTIPPTGATGQGTIALLKLKALKAGSSSVSFDQSRTRAPEFGGAPENIIGTYSPLAVTISSGATPMPTPAPVTNRARLQQIANSQITVRTHFTATAGLNPTDNTTWPKVALFANNGTNYDGPYDYGSCAAQAVGCGTPNRYTDKLIATLNVTAPTLVTNTTIPVSTLVTLPDPNDDNSMISKLSYAYFNDYWNPSTSPVTDRDVAITKVEFFGPAGQLLETFTPESRSFLDDTTGDLLNRFYFDKGLINADGFADASQNGMVGAFDKQEVETIVQNQSRENGMWKLTNEGSFNVVTASLGNKIISELVPLPTPTPTPTPTLSCRFCGDTCQKVATDAVCAAIAPPPGQTCMDDPATGGCKTVIEKVAPTVACADTGAAFNWRHIAAAKRYVLRIDKVNSCPAAASGWFCGPNDVSPVNTNRFGEDQYLLLVLQNGKLLLNGTEVGTCTTTECSVLRQVVPTANYVNASIQWVPSESGDVVADGDYIGTSSGFTCAATSTSSLQLSFKLQGLRKAGVEIPAVVTVAYTPIGAAKVVKEYAKTYSSDSTGLLSSTTSISLDGVNLSSAIPNAEVFVKTPTSLQKQIGTVTLRPGTTELLTTSELFVGDFNQVEGQKNVFNILDISLMLSEYKAINNALTNANRAFDVNFDDNFNILDASLVIANYQTLSLEGQKP